MYIYKAHAHTHIHTCFRGLMLKRMTLDTNIEIINKNSGNGELFCIIYKLFVCLSVIVCTYLQGNRSLRRPSHPITTEMVTSTLVPRSSTSSSILYELLKLRHKPKMKRKMIVNMRRINFRTKLITGFGIFLCLYC